MAGNWNRDPGFGFGSSTADYELMKLIEEQRRGSTDESPAFLDLLTGSSEFVPNEPFTEYISAPMVENAHSAIDSLMMQNNQQQNIMSKFPGKELGGFLLDLMELTLGSGMPIPTPANKNP